MHKLLLAVLFALPGFVWAQEVQAPAQATPQPIPNLGTSQAIVTNQDVTGMLKAGLSPEVIVAKIRNSKCQCDTSPAALAELKAADVPDSVILAMVQGTTPPAEKPSGLSDIHDAKSVCLINRGADLAVFNHLQERLQKWGRWTVVTRADEADLLLVFASNQMYLGTMNTASVASSATYASGTGMSLPLMSLPRFLAAVDRISGQELMAVSCERRGGAGYTAGVLVNRMRKQIERSGKPDSH